MSKRKRTAATDDAPLSPAAATDPAERGGLLRSAFAVVIMSLLVTAVYWPVRSSPGDNTLLGIDYDQLHARRIAFAQEAIRSRAALPNWYPYELMGTPFRGNIQNFPFIPTRLALLPFDPLAALAVGAILSAILAAAFTFAYARSVRVTRIGAAAAGWTFACAGFYAARVMAGHLPLLEAYPALPLLLWRVEVLASKHGDVVTEQTRPRRQSARLATLAASTGCVVLAGHPQLPFYAIVGAALYLLYRTRRCRRLLWLGATSIALGAGCAAFSLWPMAELIGRSTRLLALAEAENDVAFPARRLPAMLFPWRDGWPAEPLAAPGHPFAGYPNDAYFWETVCYVGWLPLLATAFLLIRWTIAVARRRRGNESSAAALPHSGDARRLWFPTAPWPFFVVLGVVALVTAFPVVQDVVQRVPGTFLRSPSRQVYFTTFSLALATGVAVDVARRATIFRSGRPAAVIAGGVIVTLLLAAHFADLGLHDRAFVRTIHVETALGTPLESRVRQTVGAGRAAIDYTLGVPFNRRVDDVGFFDSIMLARPYAALMDLWGAPPGYNEQALVGSDLPPRALAATGVRLVMTTADRPDLQRLSAPGDPLHVYAVPGALPRVAFFAVDAVVPADDAEAHRRLRDAAYDPGKSVMVTPDVAKQFRDMVAAAATTPSPGESAVTYERTDSDTIALRVHAATPGILRVLESWDPGWRATVGSIDVDVLCADTTFLAVALPGGNYEVKLHYDTPGAGTGVVLSVISVAALAALLTFAARSRRPEASSP